MRRVLLLVVMTVLASVMVAPAPAFGCSCAMPEIEPTAQEADAIFIGEQVGQLGRGERTVLAIEVLEVFKGDLGPTVELHSWESSATCGISFANAGVVGIAAFDDGQQLSVNLCSSSWDADVLRAHFDGPGDTPAGGLPTPELPTESGSSSAPVVVAVVVAGVLLSGLIVLRPRASASAAD